MQSSLNTLKDIDGFVSSWTNSERAEALKERIRQTLAYRHFGKDYPVFTDKKYFEDMFYTNNIPYNHIDCFQFTGDDWSELFSNCTDEEVRILQFVFDYLYQMYEGTDLTVEEMFEDGDLIDSYGLEDLSPDDIIEVWNALEKATRDGCLDNIPSAIENFLDTISDMFCDVELSNATLLNHLSVFIRFLFANENNQVVTRAFASKEVYLYESYKELLPDDIRHEADMFVEIFREPFTDKAFEDWNVDYFCEDIPEQEQTLVVFTTTKKSCFNEAVVEASDCRLFLEDSLEYINSRLPKLRQEYGSRVDSTPVLFYCHKIVFMLAFASFCVILSLLFLLYNAKILKILF